MFFVISVLISVVCFALFCFSLCGLVWFELILGASCRSWSRLRVLDVDVDVRFFWSELDVNVMLDCIGLN